MIFIILYNTITMHKIFETFFNKVKSGEIEIYNEFSLQHELGIFLRSESSGYKIQFERNSSYFGKATRVKHEIDISIFNDEENFCAIELKFPRRGQYPEQMFSFVKDIAFLEELKKDIHFKNCYAVVLVDDHNFYDGAAPEGSIYPFFRASSLINGRINKPTGAKNESYNIAGRYRIEWRDLGQVSASIDSWKYYILEC